jgi:hypothetical protein
MKKTAVIPHNPISKDPILILKNTKLKFKEFEISGEYKGWGGGLSCIREEGQLALLYISGNIKQYKYLVKITNIDKKNKIFDFKLIKKFDNEISQKFSRKKLEELGLPKRGVIRYYLDKYPKILKYVSDELEKNNIIDKTLL